MRRPSYILETRRISVASEYYTSYIFPFISQILPPDEAISMGLWYEAFTEREYSKSLLNPSKCKNYKIA